MKDKLKILAVGDLHGDKVLAKKVAEKAKKEKVDLVIIAGDITLVEMPFKDVLSPFKKINKKVLIIPGNHETQETIKFLSEEYDNIKNIHGKYHIENNIGIFGAGGGDVGINQINEKELFNLLSKGYQKIKNLEKKIMVSHMHPSGSKAEFSGFKGSKAVYKAVKKFKPDILISAHIHEAGGIEEKIGKTKILNVSRKAKILEI